MRLLSWFLGIQDCDLDYFPSIRESTRDYGFVTTIAKKRGLKMLQVGIAGVGGLGTVHLKTLLKMKDKVNVAALADPVEERRTGKKLTAETNLNLGQEEAANIGAVRCYNDWKELCLDPDLDIVVIAMPSDLHANAAVMALENGKHVFCEKPMALSREECQSMLDAEKASGKTLMVGQCLRFYPTYVAAKKIMDSGKFGKPLAALMNRFGGTPRSSWFADITRSGGVNLDLHIHDIDAALWWWGKPANIITKTVGTMPNATAVLSRWDYADGLTVQIEASWDAGIPFAATFRIIMENATLRTNGNALELITKDGIKEVPLDEMGGHAAEVHYFIDRVMQDQAVLRCLPEESALAVAYALKGKSEG
jgi:predicted dehydrogenase